MEKLKEMYLEKEELILAPYAAKSNNSFLTQRNQYQNDEDIRLPFQRDRDRIIHSRAFRRLMHKTQVFNANKGDHFRNRLTHTLEVNQIARSIGKQLFLNDELIEAIALGHDLGHTPFGHIGERTLHDIIKGKINEPGLNMSDKGGFKHNYQSLHIIDNLETGSNAHKGLNLTLAVRDGILKHTGHEIKTSRGKEDVNYSQLTFNNIIKSNPPITLEGQVVAISDEIAQCSHDLEDGIRANIISPNEIITDKFIKRIITEYKIDENDLINAYKIRNTLIKNMVNYLINNVYLSSKQRLLDITKFPDFSNEKNVYKSLLINFDDTIKKEIKELSDLITKLVISSQQVSQADAKAEYIIKKLYRAYFIHPQQLPDYILNRYFTSKGETLNRTELENIKLRLQSDAEFQRLICDHISGMTDQYAAREYKKLYEPEYI